MKEKERLSNIELLRIISMFFILLSHFSSHGNFIIDSISINSIFIEFIQILGKIGVNIFILISGFFLIEKKEFNIRKLIILWFQILFYSLTMSIIYFIIKGKINYIILIKSILPITSNYWWFASTYFVLFMLYPYLNKMANSLTKREYKNLLVLLTIIWCIIPTLTTRTINCNNLLWFIYLYLLSGYYKKNLTSTIKINIKKYTIITLLSLIICILIITISGLLNIDYKLFFGIQKLPTLIVSLLLFILFNNLRINNNKLINNIAKCTFGIYLIHDNYIYRKILWQQIFKVNKYFNYNIIHFICYTFIVVIIIFTICGIIEYLRSKLEKKAVLYIEKKKVHHEKNFK